MACSWDDLLEIGVGDFGDAFDGGVVGVVKLPCLSHFKNKRGEAQPSPVHQGFKALYLSPDALCFKSQCISPIPDVLVGPSGILFCSMPPPGTIVGVLLS